MPDVLNDVLNTAAGIFSVDVQSLNGISSPLDVDNWNSVQHLNLILALEVQYAMQFEPEEIEGMRSLGDIARIIELRLRA